MTQTRGETVSLPDPARPAPAGALALPKSRTCPALFEIRANLRAQTMLYSRDVSSADLLEGMRTLRPALTCQFLKPVLPPA